MYWHWLFVFTRITVNVPRIVINCFGDITSGWDGSSSHVMPTRIGVVAGIYGCDRIQQPCHPRAGLCGGLGSMSAVFACEKTHICPWANPGLLAGRPGSADKKTRVFFCATPGGLSRHVIPALTCAEARKSTIRRSQSMPAAIYYRPFFLIRKGQFCASRMQSRVHSNYAEAKQNQRS